MKCRYRKAGVSGRGEGRIRYYADDAGTFKYLCTIEGKTGSWRVEAAPWDQWKDSYYKTRQEAVEAFMRVPGSV